MPEVFKDSYIRHDAMCALIRRNEHCDCGMSLMQQLMARLYKAECEIEELKKTSVTGHIIN